MNRELVLGKLIAIRERWSSESLKLVPLLGAFVEFLKTESNLRRDQDIKDAWRIVLVMIAADYSGVRSWRMLAAHYRP